MTAEETVKEVTLPHVFKYKTYDLVEIKLPDDSPFEYPLRTFQGNYREGHLNALVGCTHEGYTPLSLPELVDITLFNYTEGDRFFNFGEEHYTGDDSSAFSFTTLSTFVVGPTDLGVRKTRAQKKLVGAYFHGSHPFNQAPYLTTILRSHMDGFSTQISIDDTKFEALRNEYGAIVVEWNDAPHGPLRLDMAMRNKHVHATLGGEERAIKFLEAHQRAKRYNPNQILVELYSDNPGSSIPNFPDGISGVAFMSRLSLGYQRGRGGLIATGFQDADNLICGRRKQEVQ